MRSRLKYSKEQYEEVNSAMALKDTCKTLKSLLEGIQSDLDKAEAGNKAAAQRVRTCTIKMEKAAKLYRKESIKAEKSGAMGKAKAAKRKTPPSKAAPSKAASKTASKTASKAPAAPPASKKANVTTKKIATARKKPTAKLPKAGRKKR